MLLKKYFGTIIVDNATGFMSENIPCEIGYYKIEVFPKEQIWFGKNYYYFVGKTSSGHILSNDECKKIMDLKVIKFSVNGEIYGGSNEHKNIPTAHILDNFINKDKFIRKLIMETDISKQEEINFITEKSKREKSELSRKIESLKNELRQLENSLSNAGSIVERIKAEKRKTVATRDLKLQQQSLFMDKIKIESELEQTIQKLTDNNHLTAKVKRLFVVKIINLN